MRPNNLKTKLFLDSGDPAETKTALQLLGFLDGQTTNPTLISKNPTVKEMLASGKRYTKEEIYAFYKTVVKEISALIPQGSVSIEVYADKTTSAEGMVTEGKDMFSWIPNAHIKYPVITEGLKAAEQSVNHGIRVNMTLVFSQEQGAAVYAATRGARKDDVFLSPFIGRLDDTGKNGLDFIKNTIEMYKSGDGHVEVLTASVRSYDHLMAAFQLGSDIVTAPLTVYKEWVEKGMNVPDETYHYSSSLEPMPYENIDINQNWQDYNIHHDLTDKGIEKFVSDWTSLIG